MLIDYAAITHPGKIRKNNEDAFLLRQGTLRQIAVEHQIPVIENPPLAQALYKSVEPGQEIPPHLYRAVAEILAYIFKLMKGRLPG